MPGGFSLSPQSPIYNRTTSATRSTGTRSPSNIGVRQSNSPVGSSGGYGHGDYYRGQAEMRLMDAGYASPTSPGDAYRRNQVIGSMAQQGYRNDQRAAQQEASRRQAESSQQSTPSGSYGRPSGGNGVVVTQERIDEYNAWMRGGRQGLNPFDAAKGPDEWIRINEDGRTVHMRRGDYEQSYNPDGSRRGQPVTPQTFAGTNNQSSPTGGPDANYGYNSPQAPSPIGVYQDYLASRPQSPQTAYQQGSPNFGPGYGSGIGVQGLPTPGTTPQPQGGVGVQQAAQQPGQPVNHYMRYLNGEITQDELMATRGRTVDRSPGGADAPTPVYRSASDVQRERDGREPGQAWLDEQARRESIGSEYTLSPGGGAYEIRDPIGRVYSVNPSNQRFYQAQRQLLNGEITQDQFNAIHPLNFGGTWLRG